MSGGDGVSTADTAAAAVRNTVQCVQNGHRSTAARYRRKAASGEQRGGRSPGVDAGTYRRAGARPRWKAGARQGRKEAPSAKPKRPPISSGPRDCFYVYAAVYGTATTHKPVAQDLAHGDSGRSGGRSMTSPSLRYRPLVNLAAASRDQKSKLVFIAAEGARSSATPRPRRASRPRLRPPRGRGAR